VSVPMIHNKPVFSKARMKTEYPLYLMMMLPALLVFIYNYIPMAGILVAFMKYLPAKGFFGSKWVGLKNFTTLFKMANFGNVMENTIIIAVSKIVLGIIVPVTVTLMLNDLSRQKYKKTIQTIIYMPHFVSWVMLSSIFIKLLGGNGVVNQLLGHLGVEPIIFMGDNRWFRFTLIFTHIWKEFGYGTIVYLAAVAGINVELYEAAEIDGAGHWRQMLHVTLPGIAPTIVMMSALSLGNVLNAGFDQVFNMYNPLVYETGDILDTLTYRMGFDSGNFGLSTAAGLFKSIISAVLLILSYRIADKTVGYEIF
jgi:putative aldouronate transport system permease protein